MAVEGSSLPANVLAPDSLSTACSNRVWGPRFLTFSASKHTTGASHNSNIPWGYLLFIKCILGSYDLITSVYYHMYNLYGFFSPFFISLSLGAVSNSDVGGHGFPLFSVPCSCFLSRLSIESLLFIYLLFLLIYFRTLLNSRLTSLRLLMLSFTQFYRLKRKLIE